MDTDLCGDVVETLYETTTHPEIFCMACGNIVVWPSEYKCATMGCKRHICTRCEKQALDPEDENKFVFRCQCGTKETRWLSTDEWQAFMKVMYTEVGSCLIPCMYRREGCTWYGHIGKLHWNHSGHFRYCPAVSYKCLRCQQWMRKSQMCYHMC